MLNRFISYIKENNLIGPGQKVLLAVSGGIDSMLMFRLFQLSGFPFGVAHCNFNLRGTESDGDERFVCEQAKLLDVEFFVKRFNTKEFAIENGISIEMAARGLRYQWFENIREENGYSVIATAHHRDDSVETFLLNLSRKTGIKGLTGIKSKTSNIIRPLLFATRSEIEGFVNEMNYPFRVDSSNCEIKFQRNIVRNQILPLFGKINENVKVNIADTIENLKNTEAVYLYYIEKESQKVIEIQDDIICVNINKLFSSPFPFQLLYEIMSKQGFNAVSVKDMFSSLAHESGKQFFSSSKRVIKDRDSIFIMPLAKKEDRFFYIEKTDIEMDKPLKMTFETMDKEGYCFDKGVKCASLDFDKLEFPLILRNWKPGDRFMPLGVNGFKKVSDFLIDLKIPIHKKEKTWVVCSKGQIVWVVGLRIDNRFKVTENTRSILKLTLEP